MVLVTREVTVAGKVVCAAVVGGVVDDIGFDAAPRGHFKRRQQRVVELPRL